MSIIIQSIGIKILNYFFKCILTSFIQISKIVFDILIIRVSIEQWPFWLSTIQSINISIFDFLSPQYVVLFFLFERGLYFLAGNGNIAFKKILMHQLRSRLLRTSFKKVSIFRCWLNSLRTLNLRGFGLYSFALNNSYVILTLGATRV